MVMHTYSQRKVQNTKHAPHPSVDAVTIATFPASLPGVAEVDISLTQLLEAALIFFSPLANDMIPLNT